jgi:hypothetical protein
MPSVISGDANVSATEFGYLDGVTSALQTQMDAKLNIAGGKVLQVVQATTDTQTDTSSATFVNTSLTATITPSSATSKVLIFYSAYVASATANTAGYSTIFRGTVSGTNLATDRFAGTQSAAANTRSQHCAFFLDSPATTSATTYTIGFRGDGTSISFNFASTAVIVLIEVSA